ncbi:GGDEF domain-containing protein [Acholeplasma hippikon]|nr:GGDEF domain-containing protein [Acholeplasma hippikon]
MYRLKYSEEWEIKQYSNQANIVYLSSIVLTTIILLILTFSKDIFLIVASSFTLITGIITYALNRKQKYALASTVFILTISINALFHHLYLGFESGFVFYVFNICALIIFTKWEDKTKQIWIMIEVAIFLVASLYVLIEGILIPGVMLNQNWFIFYFSINLVMNVIGVANSANFYVKISKNAHQKLVELASTDSLTGLANRTSFEYKFSLIAKNRSEGVGILMIDVDNFKQINDQYGHTVGDEILVKIGSLLKKYENNECFPSRIGGEEFTVLIHTNSAETVYKYAESIRKTIQSNKFNLNIPVTISVGAVFKPKDLFKDINLFSEADNLLYNAKNDGKNKVKFKKFTVTDIT